MPQIPPKVIAMAAAGDMEALSRLDARGLTPAPEEDAAGFAARLTELNRNLAQMESALQQKGEFTVEDVTVDRDAQIPETVFEEPCNRTDALYGFRCDWVPGFFLNPRFSGLFGGCAYYFFPEFFALFIIRHSFKTRKRWLFYQRDELLAHELCHVARVGVQSQKYEELIAYQTATSAFRRIAGGVFRSQSDVFLFLGAALFQFAYQLARSWAMPGLPAWIGWAVMGAVFAFLALRLAAMLRTVRHARRVLLRHFHGDLRAANAALFHATDDEIEQLAHAANADALLAGYAQTSLRWQILRHRFPESDDTPCNCHD